MSDAATAAAGLIPVVGNYIAAASDYKNGHYIMAGVDLVFAALDETGVYTSKVLADAAVNSHKQLPGFVDFPDGFTVNEVELNKDDWNEGFVHIISEENSETGK